jgi:hypothetical protein
MALAVIGVNSRNRNLCTQKLVRKNFISREATTVGPNARKNSATLRCAGSLLDWEITNMNEIVLNIRDRVAKPYAATAEGKDCCSTSGILQRFLAYFTP